MSLGRDGSDDGNENTTPPTRSYIDALLGGKLTETELASLRAEMKRGEPAPAPADDDDEDGVRTRFHTYSLEERQSSRPSGYMQAVKPPPDDDDDAPTLFRPSSQPLAKPASEPAPRPASEPAPKPPSAPSRRAMSQPGTWPPAQPSRPPSQPAPSVAPSTTRPPSAPRTPPSSRPSTGPRTPPSARAASHFTPPKSSRPMVDLGDFLVDEIPRPPDSAPLSVRSPGAPPQEEVPLSVPSLRSYDQRAIDESYLDAIGGPKSVPRIAVSPGELRCLPLGAQAGFLVSCIDGVSTVDDIIDISGLSRLETLRILYDLVQHGAVEIGQR